MRLYPTALLLRKSELAAAAAEPASLRQLMCVKRAVSLAVHAAARTELAMDQHDSTPSFWKTPFGVVATLLAVAASAYLYVTHKDHVLALLPYAILAACPLMHMFMHRGHGHGKHSSHADKGEPS